MLFNTASEFVQKLVNFLSRNPNKEFSISKRNTAFNYSSTQSMIIFSTQVEKYFWPGEITQQIYHWQILPIIFEFSLWSHSSKRISNKLANGFC